MKNNAEIKRLNLALMETVKSAVLTTIDADGYPQSRAISNLRCKADFPTLVSFFREYRNSFTTFLVTDTSSSKMNQIRINPKCALYFCDPAEWHGFMLGGSVEIIEDTELKKALWLNEWNRFYPKRHTDPEFTVLRLAPDMAKGWYYKEKFEIKLKGGK